MVQNVWDAGTITGAAHYAVNASGSLVYVPRIGNSLRLTWVDRRGNEELIPADVRPYRHPRVSPDGTRIAVEVEDPANTDVWVGEVARGTFARLTTNEDVDSDPIWTPDGSRVVFASVRGKTGLFWQAADGSGGATHIADGTGGVRPSAPGRQRRTGLRGTGGTGGPGAAAGRPLGASEHHDFRHAGVLQREAAGDLARRPVDGLSIDRVGRHGDLRQALPQRLGRALADFGRGRVRAAVVEERPGDLLSQQSQPHGGCREDDAGLLGGGAAGACSGSPTTSWRAPGAFATMSRPTDDSCCSRTRMAASRWIGLSWCRIGSKSSGAWSRRHDRRHPHPEGRLTPHSRERRIHRLADSRETGTKGDRSSGRDTQ